MWMYKICSLFLCLTLVIAMAMPVMAVSNDSGWMELLEVVSIQDNGENIFRMGSSYTLSIPMPKEMRVRKIDMLIRVPAPHPITSASCTVNSTTYQLSVLKIGDNLVRIVGTLPDATYEVINIKLGRSGTSSQPYEVLSCKITPLSVMEFDADASVHFNGYDYPTNYHIDISGSTPDHGASSEQFRIDVRDWAKYDSLTIWGSVDGISIDSIRANLYLTGLPMTVNFLQYNDGGEWVEHVFETDPYNGNVLDSGASFSTPFYGKYLYCITIDLSDVDRSLTDSDLHVYMTGHCDTYAYYSNSFNCQYVNGRITTADTSSVTWWQKFTNFMTGLFDGDTADSDQYQDEAGQQRDELDNMNDQLDDVTKPAVDGIQMDVGNYIDGNDSHAFSSALASLTGNSLLLSMMCITLTIALVGYVLYGKR